LVGRPGVEGTPPLALLPARTSVAELEVLPELAPILVFAPGRRVHPTRHVRDVVQKLAAADVADPQFLEATEQLLVEEAAVDAEDDGHVLTVVLPDELHDLRDDLRRHVARVATLLAAAEDGVDDERSPSELERLEALDLLVRRLRALPNQRLVVVHHHRVQPQQHDRRLLDLEPPEEQGTKHATEYPDPAPAETREEALHRMGGRHPGGGGL